MSRTRRRTPVRSRCGRHRVDAVFLATVLGEVPDKDLCVEEVRRSLRPGGLLTIVETRRDSDFIPLASVCELLARHGLNRPGFHDCSGYWATASAAALV